MDRDLAPRLEALRREVGDTVRIDQVAEVVRALLGTLGGDLSAADLRLYHEVESLAAYIQAARREIAALRPQDIQQRYLATATDEMDAIVDATESATNTILDAAERIEALMGEVPPAVAGRLTEATTQIYEACNFQDITGQRINKVVKTLKHIEETVAALTAAFGAEVARAEEARAAGPDEAEAKPPTDADLLNGPQLPGKASRQDEVDALLARFD